MRRKTKKAIRNTAIVVTLLIGILVVVSFLLMEKPREYVEQLILSEQVKSYQPLVEKYAKNYGVEQHVDTLLAMMMQESGGRGGDPMQASESFCGDVGCIDDPELSIKQGVYYFSENLEAADGDLELAIQSYNFGKGFIHYVQEKTGKYTQDVAIDFSQEMYENAEDKSIYSCLREEAKQYDACYGDIYYVRDVMEYRQEISRDQYGD